MVAVMLPAAEYHALVQTVRIKIAAFLFIASFFILISVLWTSKKYVAPILKGLEQIKANTDLHRKSLLFWKSRISLPSSQNRIRTTRQLYPL